MKKQFFIIYILLACWELRGGMKGEIRFTVSGL